MDKTRGFRKYEKNFETWLGRLLKLIFGNEDLDKVTVELYLQLKFATAITGDQTQDLYVTSQPCYQVSLRNIP